MPSSTQSLPNSQTYETGDIILDGDELSAEAAVALKMKAAMGCALHLQGAGYLQADGQSDYMTAYEADLASASDPFESHDYLNFLALQRAGDHPLAIANEIRKVQQAICSAIPQRVVFVGRTGSRARPAEFYETYPLLRKVMASLGTPIAVVADNCVFTIVSINPDAALIAADILRQTISAKLGYIPFVSVVITGYAHWIKLCEMHFQL